MAMMIVGPMSMKVPRNSRMRLMSSRMTSGFSDSAPIQSISCAGMCRYAISQAKEAAVPMMSSTIAVVRTAPSVACDEASTSSWSGRRVSVTSSA